MDPLIQKAILLGALIVGGGVTRWAAWNASKRVRKGFYVAVAIVTAVILGVAASRGGIGHLPNDLALAYSAVFLLAWGWPAFLGFIKPSARAKRDAGAEAKRQPEESPPKPDAEK